MKSQKKTSTSKRFHKEIQKIRFEKILDTQ